MRKELYKDSKLIEVEEVLDKAGVITYSKYDGEGKLLEEREAKTEEKQAYQEEQLEIQKIADFQTIKTLSEKVSSLTTSEIQQSLKLILKYLNK